jgi:hypothetical protein
VGHDYFKEPRSLLATREGEVCMKYKDHHMRHPHGHLGARASAQGTRSCAWPDDQFGRGQNPVLGWSDPTFSAFIRPKSSWGRSRPLHRKRDRVLFACPAGGVAQGKRNHFSVGDTAHPLGNGQRRVWRFLLSEPGVWMRERVHSHCRPCSPKRREL